MSMEKLTQIKAKDIEELLTYFSKNTYRAKETCATTELILSRCLELFKLDYKCMVVSNQGGELCNSYPSRLIIPESEVVPEGMEESELPCPLTLASPSVQPHNPTQPFPAGVPSFAAGAPSFSAVVSGVPQSASVAVNGSQDTNAHTQRKCSLPGDVGRGSNGAGGTSAAETQSDGSKLRELILKAKFARCRARFPVPVILYKGNYLCRSATLSGGPEMYGRSGIEYLFAATTPRQDDDDDDDEIVATSSDWQLFDRVRSLDIRLLKACSVGTIVDLMVEKKKVKFGMYVTSSEKVDKENRYCDFNIVSLPYPGCEFFREFRDLGYVAEALHFNWSQAFVDAHLVVPDRSLSARVSHDWAGYRKWDLVRLSQNYLKLLLAYVHEGGQGLLLHCISGWDRTPLFLSLLRLSLWADGSIHSSLDHFQILYLTIAYDWLAFGHDLQDRLAKGEEIFFFCFHFLKYITSDDFTVGRRRHASSDSASLERLDCGVLLEAGDGGLSSAGSSNSLNSSCSSSRSSHPPTLFRTGRGGTGGEGDGYDAHLTWPYGSYTGELDFDDMSPNLSRASSTSSSSAATASTRGIFGRSSFREGEGGSSEGRLTVRGGTVGYTIVRTKDSHKSHRSIRSRNGHSESSGESSSGGTGSGDQAGSGDQTEPPHVSTSPVAVPVPRRSPPAPRQRQESTSSVGSWQMLDLSGSFQEREPGATPSQLGSAGSRLSRVSGVSELLDSATTIKEEEGSLGSEQSIIVFNRPERLAKVRSLFYNLYVSTIGLSSPNGRNETGLGTLVSNFAQKVGIRQSTSRYS